LAPAARKTGAKHLQTVGEGKKLIFLPSLFLLLLARSSGPFPRLTGALARAIRSLPVQLNPGSQREYQRLIGMLSFLARMQGRFIYFPRRYRPDDLERAQAAGIEGVRFRTSQGNQTAFFWRRPNSGAEKRNIWLVFGGNGTVALDWLNFVADAADPDAAFLLVDYPGYGFCDGNPTPESILENAEGALEALMAEKQGKFRAEALGLFGHSLGGAAAFQFAARHRVRKVIAISTFTTMDAMVRATIRISLGQLLQHRFDNISSLKAILSSKQVPDIFLFHGEADEIIPLEMGRALAQLDPSRIRFVAVPGAHHNDVVEKALPLGLQSALSNGERRRP
jgi:uncharacterized protein